MEISGRGDPPASISWGIATTGIAPLVGAAVAAVVGVACGGASSAAGRAELREPAATASPSAAASPGRPPVVITHTEMELVDPMLFEWDDASIGPAMRRNLRAAAQTLAAHDDIRLLEVRGHADPQERRPRQLAAERARRALELLVELGIDARRLRAVGRGADEPAVLQGDRRERAANRRLELIISDGDAFNF